jgi:hypothetical protein
MLIDQNILIHNHFPNHKCISDKKNLLKNLEEYYRTKRIDPFCYLP